MFVTQGTIENVMKMTHANDIEPWLTAYARKAENAARCDQ